MKKMLLCLICIILLIFSLAACNKESNQESSDETVPASDSTTSETLLTNGFTVKTDYAVLVLPSQYSDAVKATFKDDCVHLVSGKQKLMDLYFNSDKGTVLGTFTSEKGQVKLSMVSYKVSAKSDYVAMQDDCLNEILKGLMKDYAFKTSK